MNDYAIIVNPKDNVAVVKKEVAQGTTVELQDGRVVCVNGAVSVG